MKISDDESGGNDFKNPEKNKRDKKTKKSRKITDLDDSQIVNMTEEEINKQIKKLENDNQPSANDNEDQIDSTKDNKKRKYFCRIFDQTLIKQLSQCLKQR